MVYGKGKWKGKMEREKKIGKMEKIEYSSNKFSY
jgi:hypothetical protein